MSMKQRVRISKGGQISIPAAVRKRWQTGALSLEDRGDRIVLAPAPDDPVEAAAGSLAEYFSGADIEEIRQGSREDERAADDRRRGKAG